MVTLLTAVYLGGCKDEDEGIVGVCPVVESTNPENLAVDVPLNQIITATFNEDMNAATITPGSLSLQSTNPAGRGLEEVTGELSFDDATNTITFVPSSNLQASTTYTARVAPSAKDEMGNALQAPYVWTFSTGEAPTVVSTDPANLATNVALDKVLSVQFSEAMDPLSLTTSTFTLTDGTTPVTGTVSYAGTTATFTPTAALVANTTYTATITQGATSASGTPIGATYAWSFETAAAPMVTSSDPANSATNVALNKVLSVEFSEAMDPATISTSSFTLMRGTTAVTGSVSYTGTTATFTPVSNLLSGTTYTATITNAAQNLSGIPLASNFTWTFSTNAPLGPPVVDLKSLIEYGIIAGVGVSNNAGPSEIRNMNVGIHPGVRTSITGFFDVDGGPGLIVNGNFHASDDATPTGIAASLNQAKLDLVEAYDAAMGASTPAPAIAPADLGGQTLAPGIWTSASTMLLQNGNLTLDAQGDENAVWIFKVGSSFTSVGSGPFPSAAGGNVILTGGAKASNVFWVVGASAIIGDFTSFKGNVLAFSSITMNSGAQAEGRMLARNGSVVLTSTNIINRP